MAGGGAGGLASGEELAGRGGENGLSPEPVPCIMGLE